MTPLARVLGVLLPACAADGAAGLPPPPADLATLRRANSPNSALAAPPGFMPARGRGPDITTPVYALAATDLLAALAQVAARQPRTYAAPPPPGAETRRADWVARSALCNFPDQISAQVFDAEAGASRLVLFSRSLYGYSDFGVNARRIAAWLAALPATGH